MGKQQAERNITQEIEFFIKHHGESPDAVLEAWFESLSLEERLLTEDYLVERVAQTLLKTLSAQG